MADANRASDPRRAKKPANITRRQSPIADRPAAGLPMPAQIDRIGGVRRELSDNRIKHPPVKSGGMGDVILLTG